MQSQAPTVAKYLAELPKDRKEAIEAVRAVILKNLGKGFEEGMQYGMIGYYVPHSIFPAGYHCKPEEPLPFVHLASQKNNMALYLMCIYGDLEHREKFLADWKKTGKKLDMGKACIRFKKLDDLPLKVIGNAIRRISCKNFIAFYEDTLKKTASRPKKKAATTTAGPKKKAVAKKKKTPAKKNK